MPPLLSLLSQPTIEKPRTKRQSANRRIAAASLKQEGEREWPGT
jgi:hypothetical protein